MDTEPKISEKVPAPSGLIEAHKPIKNLREIIANRIIQRDTSSDLKELNSFMDAIVEKVAVLEAKYPNARKYLILHVLVGSSVKVSEADMIYDDFPGDDSIREFLKELEEKYK